MVPRRKRLNGWQRIWIVLTGVSWLGFAVIYPWQDAYRLRSNEYEARRYLQIDLANPMCEAFANRPFSMLKEPRGTLDCWYLYNERKYAQFHFGDQVPYSLQTYSNNLDAQQIKHFLSGFGVLSVVVLVFSALLYAAGTIIAWIRRGFSPD
jgi:hypothetical protein